MSTRQKILFIILLLTFLFSGLAQAGIVIEEISYYKKQPADKEKTVIYISNNRVKVVESEGGYWLWDFNKGTLYLVNPQKKSYAGGDFIEGVVKEIKESILQIQQKMSIPSKETTPPKPIAKIKFTVKNTGQTSTIAGYLATKYEIYRDKKLYQEVWASQVLESDINKELDYKKFQKFFRDLEQAIRVELGRLAPTEEDLDATELTGYDMKTINHSIQHVSEIIKVEKKTIPEKDFHIPAGYKKVSTRIFWEMEEEEKE